MLTRLNRLDAGGHLQRDGQHMAVVQGLEDEFDAAVAAHRARFAGTPVPAELERVRWLIEELRVSFFAQELGTSESVSPQRLRPATERWKPLSANQCSPASVSLQAPGPRSSSCRSREW